mmetsp:Transcript_109085/g.315157  ORF Transcript_109085/g.315157 Transcript_109085/m.315157 type:complete len:319 (+) Transcript_109085:616-1572(+)
MIEQTCEGKALLLARRKILLPVAHIVQLRMHKLATVCELQVGPIIFENLWRHVSPSEAEQDILVCPALGYHLLLRVWVDDHIAKRADRNEVHLRYEVHLLRSGHGDRALHQRPQAPDHTEKRGLPTAIWSRHKDTLPALDGEVQVFHQQSPVRLVHGHLLELETRSLLKPRGIRPALGRSDLVGQLLRPALQAGHQSAYPASQAAQAPHAVRQLEQVLNGCSHRFHVPPSGREVCGDLVRRVRIHVVEPKPQRPREQEQADDGHKILVQILADDLGLEGHVDGADAVRREIAEVEVQNPLLRHFAARERNLLAIHDQL